MVPGSTVGYLSNSWASCLLFCLLQSAWWRRGPDVARWPTGRCCCFTCIIYI